MNLYAGLELDKRTFVLYNLAKLSNSYKSKLRGKCDDDEKYKLNKSSE